jgi:hypothetical protein
MGAFARRLLRVSAWFCAPLVAALGCSSGGGLHGAGGSGSVHGSTGSASGSTGGATGSTGGSTTSGSTGSAMAGGTGGSDGGSGNLAPTQIPISLKTMVTGNFVTVSGGSVTAAATSVGAGETLTLTDLNGGALQDGDAVWLADGSGAYLSAVGGGGAGLTTVTSTPGDAETFLVTRFAGPGTVTSGDAIAIRAMSQIVFVSALDGGGSSVRCDQPHGE